MSDQIKWLRQAAIRGIKWWGHRYGTFAPLEECMAESADLLEANAAEIATANALMDDMCTRIEGLEAENEKLRAVYEAVDAAIKDEHEQGHDLDDLTPLWADVEQALAAVEQSEAGDELLEISGKPGTEERADLYSADTQSKGSPDAWL